MPENDPLTLEFAPDLSTPSKRKKYIDKKCNATLQSVEAVCCVMPQNTLRVLIEPGGEMHCIII